MSTRFEHVGLLYRGRDDYVEGCTRFIRQARAAGDPVLVAVPEPNGAVISQALGDDVVGVEFADLSLVGRNPGRILPWVLWAFARANGDRKAWIICEAVWPD